MNFKKFSKTRIIALLGGVEVCDMILNEIMQGHSLQEIEAFINGIKESSENLIKEYEEK